MKKLTTGVLVSLLVLFSLFFSLNCSGTSSTKPVKGDSAYLTGLSLSTVSLNESFNKDSYSYTANCSSSVDEVTLSPVLEDSNASISFKKNGTAATATISLDVGNTTVDIVVISEDEFTEKTYTVIITRADGNAKDITSIDCDAANHNRCDVSNA